MSIESEGGHMSAVAGRVVRTPDAELPYKAVVTHNGSADTERAFATVQECEAFIRRNTPVPALRCTVYDRGSPEVRPNRRPQGDFNR